MTIGSVTFQGTTTSCGCVLCQPVSSRPQPNWSQGGWTLQVPPTPALKIPTTAPTSPEIIRARIMALLQVEFDALPTQIMPEDWRESVAHRALLRLREAVQVMDLAT